MGTLLQHPQLLITTIQILTTPQLHRPLYIIAYRLCWICWQAQLLAQLPSCSHIRWTLLGHSSPTRYATRLVHTWPACGFFLYLVVQWCDENQQSARLAICPCRCGLPAALQADIAASSSAHHLQDSACCAFHAVNLLILHIKWSRQQVRVSASPPSNTGSSSSSSMRSSAGTPPLSSQAARQSSHALASTSGQPVTAVGNVLSIAVGYCTAHLLLCEAPAAPISLGCASTSTPGC